MGYGWGKGVLQVARWGAGRPQAQGNEREDICRE